MKDPAFLFYPNDYLGGTMGMTFEEKGAYMELLMMQFNRGHMTSHMIGQTVGQLWDNIKDKFSQDEKGLYYNERLEIEQNKRKAFTDSRKNNIKGKNQYSKPNKKTGHMTSHMENRDINENDNINKDENKKDCEKIIKIFNDTCPNLPQVLKLTSQRETAIKSRIKEYSLAQIGDVIQNTADSEFLNGKNDRNWRADFDWIFKPSNFIKILENKYKNNNNGRDNKDEQRNEKYNRILQKIIEKNNNI